MNTAIAAEFQAGAAMRIITPDPLRVGRDLPDTNKDKCFQQMVSAELLWCSYGFIHHIARYAKSVQTLIQLAFESPRHSLELPAFSAQQQGNRPRAARRGRCGKGRHLLGSRILAGLARRSGQASHGADQFFQHLIANKKLFAFGANQLIQLIIF